MKVTINGKEFIAEVGDTILTVAKKNNINIPTLCFHSDLTGKGSCGICVVEANGKVVRSCITEVEEGMTIETDTSQVEKARKINLELLFSQHKEECSDCVWFQNCKMLELAKKYGSEINRFEDRKKDYPLYSFGNILEFDSSKCIDCKNCIEVCKKQGVGFLKGEEKGSLFKVVPEEGKSCVYCGQCIIHCPAGAFESKGEFEEIEKPFSDKNKKVIFQIAPAVRATIGEEFNLPYGAVSMGKLVSALKQIGADFVFDVSSGADITTIEESKEFLERAEKGELPMFTSCCPSWVRFVELYYPDFIPALTTVRSPHIILGGLIKKYFAKKENIKPEDIVVVSVMPCIAKKYEAEREELEINGFKPVDYVLTTREVGRLLRKKGVDFKNIKEIEADFPFGEPTGSGVTYGLSGGVMQSAYHNITGKEVAFTEIKKGVKEAEVDFNGKKLRLAIIHGLDNAREMLDSFKNNPHKYDYVEIMSCPGGCIGGGGQSIPTDEEIRNKRREGLHKAGKERKVRKAEDSEEIKRVYEEYFISEDKISEICHTQFYKHYKINNPFMKKEK